MSNIRFFRPVLHFSRMVIWHNGDQHNTNRGNWFYRDADGALHGPFCSRSAARIDMMHRATGGPVAMRTPFERDGSWWWKKDTPEGPEVSGPYTTEAACRQAINKHIQEIKDSINDYR